MKDRSLSDGRHQTEAAADQFCPVCGVIPEEIERACAEPGCAEPHRQVMPGDVTCCDFCGALLIFDKQMRLNPMSDDERDRLYRARRQVYVMLLTNSAMSFLGRRRPPQIEMARRN